MENDKSLKRSASDLLLYKSISGGVLAIPASSKPKNMVFYQRKETDTDYIFNTWAKLGGSSSYENVCKTHHPKEDLKVCLTKAWNYTRSKFAVGGVTKFTATHPITNKLDTWKPCLTTHDAGALLDYTKRYLAGYYSVSGTDGTGACRGDIWKLKGEKDTKDNKGSAGMTNLYVTIGLSK